MIGVAGLSVFFAVILYLQLPPIMKRKNIREIGAYTIFMLLGATYSYGYVLDIEMPNPTQLVNFIFRPVTQVLDKLLGG